MSLCLEKTQTSGDGSVPDLAPLMRNSSLGVTWNLTLPTGHALKGCNYAYKHPLSCWEQIQDWKGTQVSMFMRPQCFNSSLKKQIPGIHGVHLSSLDFLQTTGSHSQGSTYFSWLYHCDCSIFPPYLCHKHKTQQAKIEAIRCKEEKQLVL